MAEFKEELHPRGGKGSAAGGRFVSKGGGGPPHKEIMAGVRGLAKSTSVFKQFINDSADRELTKSEKAAVAKYVGEEGVDINADLRKAKGKKPEWDHGQDWDDVTSKMDSAIASSTMKENVAAYRGVSEDFADAVNAMEVGDSWIDYGYTSTAIGPHAAIDFADNMDNESNAILKIRLDKGTHALVIDGVESEILLPRESKFTYIGDEGKFKVFEIQEKGDDKKDDEKINAIGFVSPNIGNLSFEEAKGELDSERQKTLASASDDIDVQIGIPNPTNRPVLGAWADGAENSVMFSMSNVTMDQARAAAAMKGYLANQKAVLLFGAKEGGQHFMADFKAKGSLDEIHKQLLDYGLAFHTIEPTKDGATVHIFGMDGDTLEAVGKMALSEGTTAKIVRGDGEFLGTHKEDGTDEEQRADARRQYEATIEKAAARQNATGMRGRDIRSTWDHVRDRWGKRLGY